MTIPDLPEPDQSELPHSPLELVVWQLQFAEALEVMEPQVGTNLQDALNLLGAEHFSLERVATGPAITLALGPGSAAPAPPDPQEGWRLHRQGLVVTVDRGSLTIESTAYTNWSDLRAVVGRALESLASSVELRAQQRLGMRFVDKIMRPDVETVRDWSPWIEGWLLGPVQEDGLAGSVSALAQQFEFSAGSDIQLTLRSRIFHDPERRGRSTCLLDTDAFRTGYRRYETNEVLQTSDSLNILSLQVFQAAITPALYETLAGSTTSD